MAITEALRLLITADTAGAVRGIQQVGRTADRELSRSEKNLDKWGNRLTTVGAGMVGFGAIAAFGLGQAAKSASDLGEAVNASNVVFGDAVGIVDGYAKDSATSMGLSETAFRSATTQMGAQLQNLGFDQRTAAESSVRLTQRAADMASVFNTDVTQATEAIGAALRGERDPIERFGVSINEAAVKAQAMKMGLAGATGELSLNAKALATEALILEQTAKIAGDFVNTSDSMANKQRIVSAEMENLKASIGEGVLPVMETLLDLASDGIGVFQGLDDATGGAVGKIATIGTVASLGVGGLALLAGQVIKSRRSLVEARDAISGFVGSGGLGGLARTLAKGGGVIGGLLLLEEILDRVLGDQGGVTRANLGRLEADMIRFGKSGKVTGELVSIAGEDFNDLKDALSDVDLSAVESARASVERFSTSIPGVGRAFDSGFARGVDEAKAALDDFDKALANIAMADPDLAFQILEAAANAAGVEIEDILPHLDDYDSAIGNAASASALAGGDVDEFGRSMEGAASFTDQATAALEGYASALAAQFDPLLGYTSAVDKNADALAGEAEAQAELDRLRADGTATAGEIREAEEKLDDAHRDVQSSAVDLAGREAELIAKFKSGELSAEELTAEVARLEDQNYLSSASAADLRRKIEGIKSKSVSVDMSIFGVERVLSQLSRIPSSINVPVNLRTGRQTLTGALGGITFHEGGIVPGPRGREVAAILQAGEHVTSLAEMDSMRTMPAGPFGGGGGGTVINLTVDARGSLNPNGREIADLVTAGIRRAGELGMPITVRGRSLS